MAKVVLITGSTGGIGYEPKIIPKLDKNSKFAN